MFILKFKTLLFLAIVTIGTVPTQALADGKVYPGIMCQKSLGIGSYAGGAVRNDSNSGSLTVECPVVRDIVYGNIHSAQVRLYRASSSAGIWCTLHARSFWGNVGHQQFKAADSFGNWKTLNFSSISDYDNGHYYIWCAIPPSSGSKKSRLIGYRLDES